MVPTGGSAFWHSAPWFKIGERQELLMPGRRFGSYKILAEILT